MKSRKIIAFVTLVVVLVLPAVALTASAPGGMPFAAEWGVILPLSPEEAIAFGFTGVVMCAFLPVVGSVACGLAGVL